MTGVKQLTGVGSWLMMSALFLAATPLSALAATPAGNFSLQVSPSPLVATVKPGEKKELELKIRNAGTASEDLKIEARSFRFDNRTGKVNLEETIPPEIGKWLSFSAPRFTIKPGDWYSQKVLVDLPPATGFSYSFALLITRTELPSPTQAGQLLNGSVAVFALINVDRPGATRSLDLSSFTPGQTIYEYLPATFDIRLKNTGNTIAQPYGNVFISRGGNNSQTPTATLPVNNAQAYLLPGTERTLQARWDDGFPTYQTTTDASGKQQTTLAWNWDQLSHFRFGRYTAKVVAVYNDGTRDIPLLREVTFWVIPWKALLIVLAIITLAVILLRLYIKKRTEKAVRRALASRNHKPDAT